MNVARASGKARYIIADCLALEYATSSEVCMAHTQQIQANTRQLAAVADEAHDILFTADTVFPFTMFPDTITIDRVKATVTKRSFFRVSEIISIQIEDILNVEADSGPFFGSLKVWTRFFEQEPLRVNFLWREDARRSQRLLHGFIIAKHKQIDCDGIETSKLVPLLLKLGEEA